MRKELLVCAFLAAAALSCHGAREVVELRASELPRDAAMLQIALVRGDEVRTVRLVLRDPSSVRIALHVDPGETIDGVTLLDARGRPIASPDREASAAKLRRIAAVGGSAVYFVSTASR